MAKEATHAWGIASLVLGILSLILFLMPYFGIVFAILAIVFYGIQRKHEPTGIATGGLVTGIIGVVLNGVILIMLVGLLAIFSSTASSDDVIVQPTETVQGDLEPVGVPSERIRSATISVDRVTSMAANLAPIRLTVENTGTVTVTPTFDVTVIDSNGKVVCEGSPMFDSFGSIASGDKKTDEIQILSCTFSEDGDYSVVVNLLDNEYNKLDVDAKTLTVSYWGQFS